MIKGPKAQALIVHLLLVTGNAIAQNLVPNPSFERVEITSSLSTANWTSPSAKLYKYSNSNNLNTEVHFTNSSQVPNDGEYFVGLNLIYSESQGSNVKSIGDNSRLLSSRLLEPLKRGHLYRLSFYVKLSDSSNHAVNMIGGYFSIDGNPESFRGIPHVNFRFKQVLGKTKDWVLLSDIYFARGGESFLTLGLNLGGHKNELKTSFVSGGTKASEDGGRSYRIFAHYYFDNITVELVRNAVVLQDVLFEFNSTSLEQPSYKSINRLGFMLENNPKMSVEVLGHTDVVGTPKVNMDLSIARANAVKEYLTEKGIEPTRIHCKGFGATQLIAANQPEEEAKKNRRVEFRVVTY